MLATQRTARVYRSIALLIGGAMAALVWYFTRRVGIGISPDSVVYLDVARNLSAGNGLVHAPILPGPGPDSGLVPLTHFPPGYPILLWLVSASTGASVEVAARICAAAFAVANCVLVAAIGSRAAGRAFALVAASAFAFGYPLQLHVMAWSEPPFLCFSFVALLALAHWSDGRSRSRALLLAGLSGALALSMRFVGVVLAGVAFCYIATHPGTRHRISAARSATWVAALMLSPLALIAARMLSSSGSVANRVVAFHPPVAQRLSRGGRTMAEFIWPAVAAPAWLSVAVAVAAGAVLLWYFRSRSPSFDRRADRHSAFLLPLMYTVSYVAFLIVSISFLDFATPPDPRILSPVMVPIWWLLALAVARLASAVPKPYRRIAWTPLAGIALAAMAQSVFYVRDGPSLWYSSEPYASSAIWRCVEDVSRGRTIVSNSQDLIYLKVGRESVEIPMRLDPYSRLPNNGYAADSSRVTTLIDRGALIVSFNPVNARDEELERLRAGRRLALAYADSVGVVWTAARPGGTSACGYPR